MDEMSSNDRSKNNPGTLNLNEFEQLTSNTSFIELITIYKIISEFLSNILPDISNEIENATLSLSSKFSELANSTLGQYKIIEKISKNNGTLNFEGKEMSFSEVLEIVNKKLDDSIAKDMNDSSSIKSIISSFMNAIVKQNEEFAAMLLDASKMNKENVQNISSMVVNLQFQDRVMQYINNAMNLIGSANILSQNIPYTANKNYFSQILQDITLVKIKEQIGNIIVKHELVQNLDELGLSQNSSSHDDTELF